MLRSIRIVATALVPGIPLLPAAAYAMAWHPDIADSWSRLFGFWSAMIARAVLLEAKAALASPAMVVAVALAALLCVGLGFIALRPQGQAKR